MQAAFFITQGLCLGPTRIFLQAARGFVGRERAVTVICPGQSDVARYAAAYGLDVVELPPQMTRLGAAWWLRGVLRTRFVEVLFVSTVDAQRIGNAARRIGSCAAVVRHEPTFEEAGVDLATLDQVAPASRAALRAPPRGPLVVCWCGLGARLRAIGALRTIACVAARHVDFHAVIVGPGAGNDMVRMHAGALRFHGGLTFILGEEPAHRAIRAADVGWVVAEREDAAFAMLEFMAARVPVIAADEPVTRHMLGAGVAGVLVDPDDILRNAAHLTMLIAQPKRRAQLGNAGRARAAERFTGQAVVGPFESALRGNRAETAS